jgi:hypothetical protein
MRIMSAEEFNKEESIAIIEDCWVAGKLKKRGDTVKVGGNDKSQLIASGKGVKVEEPVAGKK